MRYENDLHSEWFKRNSQNLFKEEFRNYIYKTFGYTWLIIFVISLFVSIHTYYVRSVVRNYHPKDPLYIDFHDNDF